MNLLDSVEQQRAELEASLLKLRGSLNHWRTWDAEYEGLKEELDELEEPVSENQIVSQDVASGPCATDPLR